MSRNVMAAMSGGVDSSVAAGLLLRQGYNVTGVTLRLLDGGEKDKDGGRVCGLPSDIQQAHKTAVSLGMEFIIMDFSDNFRSLVLDRFAAAYRAGLTPNPCIYCNRYIKFGALMEKSESLGFDFMATGHYARIEYEPSSGRYLLKRPADRDKDQTYVLYNLNQRQLARALFPLGGLAKSHVRRLAQELGLANAQKPDSQDLCFVKEGCYADFVESYTGRPLEDGDFINLEGRVMGRHKGIARYTVGQRKGLGLSLPEPAYVVAKDSLRNRVILGRDKDLFCSALWAGDCNFIPFDRLEKPTAVTACIRYGQREQKALLHPEKDGRVLVEFECPQRAAAPGQAVVFYDGDTVVGGGTILESIS